MPSRVKTWIKNCCTTGLTLVEGLTLVDVVVAIGGIIDEVGKVPINHRATTKV